MRVGKRSRQVSGGTSPYGRKLSLPDSASPAPRVIFSYTTVGLMLGLMRKKFVGSYLFFKATNRA
jgi:hypothetical protein